MQTLLLCNLNKYCHTPENFSKHLWNLDIVFVLHLTSDVNTFFNTISEYQLPVFFITYQTIKALKILLLHGVQNNFWEISMYLRYYTFLTRNVFDYLDTKIKTKYLLAISIYVDKSQTCILHSFVINFIFLQKNGLDTL